MTITQVQEENTIPSGKYTYIGVDIDTTGRRILDEVRIDSNFLEKKFVGFIKYREINVICSWTTCSVCNICNEC